MVGASTGAAYSHVSFYVHFFFWDTQDEGTQELAVKSIFTKSDNNIFEKSKIGRGLSQDALFWVLPLFSHL